jgi:excinuclease ABC subunit B
MDADKEGFLRSRTSLVQIVGRAARNEQARVIFYADKMTTAMQEAMEETARRRHIQQAHNHQYGITPTTVVKPIPEDLRVLHGFDCPSLTPLETQNRITNNDYDEWLHLTTVELEKKIRQQTKEMKHWAGCLEFEKAAQARNALSEMKKILEMRLSVVQGDLL